MKLENIISIPDSRLESFFANLAKEQQDKLTLIEDGPNGLLDISHPDGKRETIAPKWLRLYVSQWPEGTFAARTDSHRFLSAEEGLWDSQDILEARSLCAKILAKVGEKGPQDEIDSHLQDLIIMMQSLEESNVALFDLNNELDTEISQHDPQPCIPSYEFVHELSPEWSIDAESTPEPTQEEISDIPVSKTSKRRQLPPKATPKQLQP